MIAELKLLACALGAYASGLIRLCLPCILLIYFPFPAVCQTSDIRGDPVNGFPINKVAEAYRGEKTYLNMSFKIYFPIDRDRYLPVDSELAKRLSVPPVVRTSSKIRVEVPKAVCISRNLHLKEGASLVSVSGGVMEYDVEIFPEESLESGLHEVALAFQEINEVFRELNVKELSPVAEVQIRVHVWPSREAKLQAERQPEEQRQKIGEAREPEAAEMRSRLIKMGAVILPVAVVAAFFAFRYRKWIRPTVTVKVGPGDHFQARHAVKALPGEEFSEPGTILRTLWAKDRHRKVARIKVETFVASVGEEEKPSDNRVLMVTTHHEFGSNTVPNMPGAENLRLDILVSVASSVRSGTYLADGPNGSVKIKVVRRPVQKTVPRRR